MGSPALLKKWGPASCENEHAENADKVSRQTPRSLRLLRVKTRLDTFTARVLSVVRRIPPGRVATYGDVARLTGRPRAWRAVGNIISGCARPDVPCHRVIGAGGRIGGYGGQEALKRSLLIAEGIVVSGSRLCDLDRIRWRPD